MAGTRAFAHPCRLSLPMLLAVVGVWLTPQASQADPIVFSSGELDLEVGYENGSWELGWHDHASDTGYAPADVIARFLPASLVNRPASPAFDFLGVGAGQPVYVLPQVQNPAILYPGIAAEEIESGVFDNDQVFLEIVGLRGPGDFSIWGTDAFGQPNVLLATSLGQNGPLVLLAGSHEHFNWALSQPGLYELDLVAYGFVNGRRVESERATFFLEAQAVPEPATVVVLAGLAVGCVAARRLRRKRG